MTPKLFIATYECVECGEEYEMSNCFLPRTYLPCDDCNEWTVFEPQKIIHRSFDWDSIDED